jgi:hypothetical protein
VDKTIKPSEKYLSQLTKLREQIRQAMLGQDQQMRSEFRFIESKVIEKIKEVKKALSAGM